MELEDFGGDLAGGLGCYPEAWLSKVADSDRGSRWTALFYTRIEVDGWQDKLDMRRNVCG